MRPLRLEIEGFSGFADGTEVDFGGDDLFAIVGPTGSGKSSLIDAMVFALYGVVPRYDNENLIAPVIHQRKTEARVRFDFELRGQTYTAVRVVRRTRAGATTKEARLERADDVLAADAKAMSAEVGVLLGLNFAQFCRTVVLPQGAFARFLHDRPRDRQELLIKLLDLGLYDRIRARAGQRAAAASTALTAIEARLGELGAVGEEELAAARQHAHQAAELEEQIRIGLAEQAADTAHITAGQERAGALQGSLAALAAATTVPVEVSEHDAAQRAAGDRLAAAATASRAALAALEAARADAAAATPRDLIEQWERDHRRRAEETERAARLDDLAQTLDDEARTIAQAVESLAAAEQRRSQANEQLTALAEVRLPGGLDDLASQLQAATASIEGAEAAVAEARARQAEAAETRVPAAERDSLAGRLTAATRRDELETELADLRERSRAAAAAAEAAEVPSDAALRGRQAAEAALAEVRRRAGAGALVADLEVGDDCPVCGRPLEDLPDHAPAADLRLAQQADDAAQSALQDAAMALAAMAQKAANLREQVGGVEEERAAIDEELPVEELRVRLEAIDAAARHVEKLDAVVVEAEREAESARARLTAASTALDEVRRSLNLAREHVAAIGPPAPADDPVAGWRSLADWAATTSSLAESDRAAGDSALAEAGELLDAARSRLGIPADAAGLSLPDDLARLDVLSTSVTERRSAAATILRGLEDALSAAPAADDLVTARAERERLDAAVVEASEARQLAGDEETAAQAAVEDCQADERALRSGFGKVRDAVVELGAPAPGDESLASDWAQLAEWATGRAVELETERSEIERETAELRTAVTEREDRLLSQAADAGVTTTAERLAEETAEHRRRAAGRVSTMEENRRRAAELTADQGRVQRDLQVARSLETHLRADRFERWLVEEALRELVAGATDRLLELSSGAYSLELDDDGRDFEVVDHRNADERRLVKTLSGGETFLTALALALALAERIGELADRSAGLDSLFLDEGFGTLDPDTLDVVASAIEELGATGRTVGIITHVRDLADRMPVRFEVRRTATGSEVERVAL